MRLGRTTALRLIASVSVCGIALGAALTGGNTAEAANGDPVLLGFGNSATAGTSISTTSAIGLLASTTATGSAVGLLGQGPTGVRGESGTGNGVVGSTTDNTRAGVFGENTAATGSGGAGVVGVANHNTGVQAISSNGTALEVDGVATFSRSGRPRSRRAPPRSLCRTSG
jgi:hypothetical protein